MKKATQYGINSRRQTSGLIPCLIVACFSTFLFSPASSQTIVTTVDGNSFCSGSSIYVHYSTTGSYNAGNEFVAELSNQSGSFSAPVNIGSVQSTGSGSITGVIPFPTSPGSMYRIRVVSTNPVIIGSDNGINLQVCSGSQEPSVSLSTDQTTICSGDQIIFSATAVNGGSSPEFEFLINDTVAQSSASSAFSTSTLKNGDVVSCRMNIETPQNQGDMDQTFNVGTGFAQTEWINAVALQGDGKIVAGGWFSSYNGSSIKGLIRFNADGTRDLSFNTGPGVTNGVSIEAITIQPDGKILFGGVVVAFNYQVNPYLTRINADGTNDLTFNIASGFNQRVMTIAVQPDNKIIAGGDFTQFNGVSNKYLIRLNSNGTVDTTFQ
ncbi:MAG: delta-60 repeat domain-containing protein, partial [Bacteroidetes bacterium]|nr:delta-60 repeat domain-containing protein [Bacteroidota bacterium]